MIKYPDYLKLDEDRLFLISQKAIIVNEGKILLLKINAPENKEWSGKWGLPGGLLEMGEELEDGLKRELKEETGMNIKIEKPLSTGTYFYDKFILQNGKIYKVQFVAIAYLCKSKNKQVKLSSEHRQYKWFTKKELTQVKISSDCQFAIKDYIKNN